MNRRLFVLEIGLLVLVSIAFLIVGCQGKQTSEELPVVRYVNFKVYDPVYVAIDQGFFEKRGVKVEIIGDVLAGPTAIQAVASGSAESGLSSVPAIINANAAGLPIQGVVDIQTTLDNQALQKWYVRSDSDIQSMNDLPGHVFAVNLWRSSFNYTALMGLDERGIDENSLTWVLLSFDKQIPALMEGSIDVMGLMQPYQNFADNEYGDQIREVFNDRDDVFHGSRHVSLIFVNRLWAQYNPEAAKAYTTGIADAINWIEGHEDEAKAIISKYTGIPEESVPVYHFTENGQVRPDDIVFWMDYLKQRGDLTADWLEPAAVGTNDYNMLLSGN